MSQYPKSRRGREFYHLKGHKPRPICEKCSRPPDKYQYLNTAYVREKHRKKWGPEHWQEVDRMRLVKIGFYCRKCKGFEPLP